MHRKRRWFSVLLLPLLIASCGQIPTPLSMAKQGPSTSESYPPPEEPAPPPPSVTPIPGPPPIVLGAEEAPTEDQEVYVAQTVVIAPLGSGPGELGYWEAPEAGHIRAEHFTVDLRGNIYILDQVNQRVEQFDFQGAFVTHTYYGDAARAPKGLAVDTGARIYLWEAAAYGPTEQEAVPKVKLFDQEGHLLREYLPPAWFLPRQQIWAIYVDEQGTLWVEGRGSHPNAATVEGDPYPAVVVPLGSATETFDAQRQQTMAVPGRLLETTGPVITYFPVDPGPGYIYDRQGRRAYEFSSDESLVAIDRSNSLYTIRYGSPVGRIIGIVKYDAQGRLVATIDLHAVGSAQSVVVRVSVDREGVIYALTWDTETKDAYQVIRWQRK